MTSEIKDKPKGKSRADDTRIDVRFPLSIIQAIEQIAEQDGAKIHHISGKRILTPTVIELVRIGLSQVSDKYQIEVLDVKSDNVSVKISDSLTPRVEVIEGELAELKKLVNDLSTRLSDKISKTSSIKLLNDLADSALDNLSDISADSLSQSVPDNLADIATDPPVRSPARYKVGELADKLAVRRQAIESHRDRGTLGELGYEARQDGRNWYYYPTETTS